MAKSSITRNSNRRHLLTVLLLVLMIYVIVPQLGDLHSSWQVIGRLDRSWAVIAVGFSLTTYLAAAATYYCLAFRPMRYAQLVLVEVAAMFINRLLPAGIGALGTNYAYLRRRHHSPAQSATMIAANNLIGIAGHVTILGVVVAASAGQLKNFHHFWHNWSSFQVAAGLLLAGVIIFIAWLKFGRRRIQKLLLEFRRPLLTYARHPLKLLGALSTSISLTLCNALSLTACAYALNVHLPFVAVLLIFSLGVGAGTVTPTPGGLGGFEAGLFAGFVAYGIASPTALALALLYRLISYWLPLILGALAFLTAQRQRLFST